MAFDFLPNIPAAPHENTRYIQGYDVASPLGPVPEGADVWAQGAYAQRVEFVADKRTTAQDIASGLGTTALVGDEVVADWEDLADVSKDWLQKHLAHMPALDNMRRRKSSIALANEGLVTIHAFLEVGPKVLARQGLVLGTTSSEINDEAAVYAQRSQGFITKWGRISADVDRRLAEALATYSRKAHKDHDVFADLHFDPKYFWADTSAKRMGVDPNAKLRSWAGTKLGSIALKQPEELFGCPALHMLPAMYQKMTTLAHRNGLFSETYLAEVAQIKAEAA